MGTADLEREQTATPELILQRASLEYEAAALRFQESQTSENDQDLTRARMAFYLITRLFSPYDPDPVNPVVWQTFATETYRQATGQLLPERTLTAREWLNRLRISLGHFKFSKQIVDEEAKNFAMAILDRADGVQFIPLD